VLKARRSCKRKRLVADHKRSRRTVDVQKEPQALEVDCKLLLGLRRSVRRIVIVLSHVTSLQPHSYRPKKALATWNRQHTATRSEEEC
jgi:hypothetical protein